MRKTGITQVIVKLGEPLPKGGDRLGTAAMTDEEVRAAGLSDPDAQPLAPEQLAKMRRVLRVKVLRQRLRMTHAEFAHASHPPVTTLRDGETPPQQTDAPARALLLAIERDQESMQRLLDDKAA